MRRSCLNCGGDGTPVRLRDDYPMARCNQCGLVFAEKWMEGFDESHDQYHADRLDQPLEQLYPPFNLLRLEKLLDHLGSFLRGRDLLDVGCGQGQLVLAAQRSGWHARGIDLSESAIAICKRAGLNCTVTDFFAQELDDSRYDLITMTEFIEHVPHPSTFLSRARELLREKGLIYVTTPNFSSLGRRILGGDWTVVGPGHISYFTPSMLRRVVRASGLEPVALFSKNLSPTALRRLVGRRTSTTRESRNEDRPPVEPSEDQSFRERIDRSGTLRAMKRTANACLRATRLGETLVAALCRPPDLDAFKGLRVSRL